MFLLQKENKYGRKQREKINLGEDGLYANSKIFQWDSQDCNFDWICDVFKENIISEYPV